LSIVSLALPKWAEQEDDDGDSVWEGSLLEVRDSDLWDEDSYAELADDICSESLYGACTMFEDLRDAGIIFIIYESIYLLTLVLWIVRIILVLCRVSFGPDWLAYLAPLIGSGFHIVGTVIWLKLVEVNFDDCEDASV
jgi:hypothetical protein